MHEITRFAVLLLSPLAASLGLWVVAAILLAVRRRGAALGLAVLAFGLLWVGSTPMVARAMTGELEQRYPASTVQATPVADAILLLGGAMAGRHPPKRPSPTLYAASSRVWHAAALYRAGKAKWIVVAAGSSVPVEGEQVEADAIAEMLAVLGVPDRAILREGASRNTRENAANVQPLLDRIGARRVLVVTSGIHMPRALKTLERVWTNSTRELIPATADVEVTGSGYSSYLWIPSPTGLLGVTKALKEYTGMAALAII